MMYSLDKNMSALTKERKAQLAFAAKSASFSYNPKVRQNETDSNFLHTNAKEVITDINNSARSIELYFMRDDLGKFWIVPSGLETNENTVSIALNCTYFNTLFGTIRCAAEAAKLVNDLVDELHPRLMRTLRDNNLRELYFAGEGFGAMQAGLLALVYRMLIEFYTNHRECTHSECKSKTPSALDCITLQEFVTEFYQTQYEKLYLEMWSQSESISSYKRDLYCRWTKIQQKPEEFNNLFNRPLGVVLEEMMLQDKQIFETLKINNIYTFGSPSYLSEEWTKIHQEYFYNKDSLENSKHWSFELRSDPLARFGENLSAFGHSFFALNMIKFCTIERRYTPGWLLQLKEPVNSHLGVSAYCCSIQEASEINTNPPTLAYNGAFNLFKILWNVGNKGHWLSSISGLFAFAGIALLGILAAPVSALLSLLTRKRTLNIWDILIGASVWTLIVWQYQTLLDILTNLASPIIEAIIRSIV